jgi:hypothetical protein
MMDEAQLAVELLKTLKRQATALEKLARSVDMILDNLEGEVNLNTEMDDE